MDILAAMQPFLASILEVSVSSPTPGAVVALILACLLLLMSAFVSGSEIALFSLSSSDMNEMDEDKNVADRKIMTMLSQPDRLLATILITNDFVNVAIVMLLKIVRLLKLT